MFLVNIILVIFVISIDFTAVFLESAIEKIGFLEPKPITDEAELFQHNGKEYIVTNINLTHRQASIICKYSFNATLVIIESEYLALYLAEALSETNLVVDSLWIGGKLHSNVWYWYKKEKQLIRIKRDILKFFVNYTSPDVSTSKQCLAFSREDHDIPQFPSLECDAKRPMICERKARSDGNGSTHNGWIAIGFRIYKIFSERITWEAASAKCIHYDSKSSLAVITNFREAQILGRYMLIGRPSLENAWIGAKYIENQYMFEYEGIVLSNETNENKFPPWLNGTIRKATGCLLLDRHSCNKTLFIETRCTRARAYICYKSMVNMEEHLFKDILMDDIGYRLYFYKLPWLKARDTCNMYKPKYGAKLAEIYEHRTVDDLIYVMGQNESFIQHIWLGGLYNYQLNAWIWDSSGTIVDVAILNWLKNTTYFPPIEQYNTCMNMDRENHLVAIHYGTICDYSQYFVCAFPKEKLEELILDEKNADKSSDMNENY